MIKTFFKSAIKVSLVAAVFAAFTGCTFAPVCNQSGAYAQGVTDGQYRTPENYNYAATCPNNRRRINRAYHRGYRHGLWMPRPQPVIVPVAPVPASFPIGPRPLRPHGHHPHPHPNPRPHPHPHHRHKIIPGVPTPPVQTHVIPAIPATPVTVHVKPQLMTK